MTTWHAQLQFDADTDDEARAILASWQLSDGVTVLGVMGTQNLIDEPVVADSAGAVSLDEPKAASTG
jgi:hypothetical protein